MSRLATIRRAEAEFRVHDESRPREKSMTRSTRRRILAAVCVTASVACSGLAIGTGAAAVVRPGAAAARAPHAVPLLEGGSIVTLDPTLSDSSLNISYGDEQDEVLTATVTGNMAGDEPPTGTVALDYMGSPICTVTLEAEVSPMASSGACSPTGGPIGLDVGPYGLALKYSGDDEYAASVGTGGFTVIPEMTTATMVPLGTTTYGDEQNVGFRANVASEFGEGLVTGTVTIATSGPSGTTLCSYDPSSVVECGISATDLPPGNYGVGAAYSPGANPEFLSSSAEPVNLTIARAASTTGLTRSASKVTYGREKSEHLKVSVQSAVAGTLSGSVTIKAHMAHHKSVTVCKITLTSGAGSCTLKSKALKAGKYTLTASFAGDVDFAPSASLTKTLTVKK
jgi:hypothetical protein